MLERATTFCVQPSAIAGHGWVISDLPGGSLGRVGDFRLLLPLLLEVEGLRCGEVARAGDFGALSLLLSFVVGLRGEDRDAAAGAASFAFGLGLKNDKIPEVLFLAGVSFFLVADALAALEGVFLEGVLAMVVNFRLW